VCYILPEVWTSDFTLAFTALISSRVVLFYVGYYVFLLLLFVHLSYTDLLLIACWWYELLRQSPPFLLLCGINFLLLLLYIDLYFIHSLFIIIVDKFHFLFYVLCYSWHYVVFVLCLPSNNGYVTLFSVM